MEPLRAFYKVKPIFRDSNGSSIEKKLGLTIDDADLGRYRDLNAFPMEKIKTAKRLKDSTMIYFFIDFYAGPSNRKYVADFMNEVVAASKTLAHGDAVWYYPTSMLHKNVAR